MPVADMKSYMSERRKANRVFALAYLGGKCAKCASTMGLEFDHKTPRKKAGGSLVSNMFAHGRKRLIKELEKCQLLCKKHHNQKTNSDMGFLVTPAHGTLTMATHYKCRCAFCRKAKADYMASYRKINGR